MTQKTNAIFRGVGMIGATAALMAGITFASLQNTVALDNNQFSSASANLQISNDNQNFGDSAQGFQALNLVPGAQNYSTPFAFYLKNDGTAKLNISISTNLANGNLHGIDPTKVDGEVKYGTSVAHFKLSDLIGTASAAYTVPGFTLNPDATVGATIAWKLEDGAVSGSGGNTSDPFKITFTGTSTE